MTHISTEVPSGQIPTNTCEYCGRPFATQNRLNLHRGLAHYGVLDETEKEAFETARSNEEDDLRLFRLKALGMIVILYFGFLFLYAIYA